MQQQDPKDLQNNVNCQDVKKTAALSKYTKIW